MKRFIRTLAGKTILFILCIILVCVLALSVTGIGIYTQDDFKIYTSSEGTLKERYISDGLLHTYGYSILASELSREEGDSSNITNFIYRVTDETGKVISETDSYKDLDSVPYTLTYGILRDSSGAITDYYYHFVDAQDQNNGEYYTVSFYPVEGSTEANQISLLSSVIHIVYTLRYAIYFIAAAALIAFIACFVALMHAAGRRPGTEEVYPGPLSKIPFDLMLAIFILIIVAMVGIGDSTGLNGSPLIIYTIASVLIGLNILLGLCMSLAGRVKRHAFLKGLLIYHILRLIGKGILLIVRLLGKFFRFNGSILKGLPLIWKTVLFILGITILEIVFLASGDYEGIVGLWVVERIILIPAALLFALTLRRLQKSGESLAAGDLSYHTDTSHMVWDLKQHGENLNSIASGMAIAVEDRLKSERMKTELITNVSHDIKTPLTSIINYASLIGNEPCENKTITEYSQVLVRQSEKLKRLIEDLVEASKASTGNLDVLLAPCDASVFLSQASGEYEEKLKSSDLELIVKQPENDLIIMADGRRMWRIFDNLMNNICKYSQPGTRVYLSLEEQNGNAVITFKNTSREPLDMTEAELMERFTRGDSSRNTEGNGLGLSIAKSMAELQGGNLSLSIDGDLFKAILEFPLV